MFGCGECENRKSSQISLIKLVLGVRVGLRGRVHINLDIL